MSPPRPAPEPLPVRVQGLEEGVREAVADAAALLGVPIPVAADDPSEPAGRAGLKQMIEAVGAELLAAGFDRAELFGPHEQELRAVRDRFSRRTELLERVEVALAELRSLSSPVEMLSRAPAVLCSTLPFRRAIMSRVGEGALVPEAVHVEGDAEAAAAVLAHLRGQPMPLGSGLVEAEAARRRRASLVLDVHLRARVHEPTAAAMGWSSFVASPVVAREGVVALLQADYGVGGRDVDALDRDVLWAFCSGLGHAFETAALRRALRGERDQLRRLLDWLGSRLRSLSDARIELAAEEPPPAETAERELAGRRKADREVFDGVLTRRELDVLRLIVAGRTNAEIAAELVVAEGTVKFHVNNLMRKLRASNRAEAAAAYLRITGAAE